MFRHAGFREPDFRTGPLGDALHSGDGSAPRAPMAGAFCVNADEPPGFLVLDLPARKVLHTARYQLTRRYVQE